MTRLPKDSLHEGFVGKKETERNKRELEKRKHPALDETELQNFAQ